MIDDAMPAASSLAARLQAMGHEVVTVGLDGIRQHLGQVARGLEERLSGSVSEQPVPHYLVLYGMDAANSVLETKDPDTRVSGVDSFRQVIKSGPEHRTHLIGWWRSPGRLKSMLMMGASADDIGAWVGFDVQGQDLNTFAPGQMITWSPRPGRGLFFDRFEHARPQVVIPFDTEREAS
jgi:hypothetical protein